MNELIREIAKEAGAYISDKNDCDMIDFNTSKINLEKFAKLILDDADKLKRMTNTDLVNRPFELDATFIKLCALNAPRRRQTYDDQDFQDLVDINGKSIPHVSKLKKQKKDKE